MRTLVLGGSAFVGRALVDRCVADGHEVTVLNRGQSTTALPEGVSQLVADRKNWDQMQGVLRGTTWDAVVDVSAFVQVAGQSDMARLIELLDGNVGRYVFVSSIMAYEPTGTGQWAHPEPDQNRRPDRLKSDNGNVDDHQRPTVLPPVQPPVGRSGFFRSK